MDSHFAHLRQRDNSVSMLRVKMSRRRSQSQKENRERALNSRRQLEKLVELDCSSLDASVLTVNMPTIQEISANIVKTSKNEAVIERMKQLERWKERKMLEKEKERREKESKRIFKVGLYQPQNGYFPPSLLPIQTSSIKETIQKTCRDQNGRVTRSMKQQQKPLKEKENGASLRRVESAVGRTTRSQVAVMNSSKVLAAMAVGRVLSTRQVNRPVTAAPPKAKVKAASDTRAPRTRANVNLELPLTGRGRNCKGSKDRNPPGISKETEKPGPISSSVEEVEDQTPSDLVPQMGSSEAQPSFAPQDFMFQAPVGLSSFKFEPLTPCSAEAFLTPSSSFSFPPVPVFDLDSQAELKSPSSAEAPLSLPHLSEPQHDVPYFRSEVNKETERLADLCVLWEAKLEDESIPEEMLDRMRTAVGQARLLMKERFTQFSGLIDDCELGRGEKIITCTDLQGFWDMVYFQVEDVNKKFDALKEAETRGWVEEHKAPPPLQRRKVKKQPSAAAKPAGTNGAAKSRLAAVKAAMKAKQQAATGKRAAEDNAQPKGQMDTVVFQGGFFQVESPAKPAGVVRRSSRLTAAMLPGASPCLSLINTTPGRVTRRSIISHASPAQASLTPTRLSGNLGQSPQPRARCQPSPTQQPNTVSNVSVSFSPIMEVPSEGTLPDQTEPVSRPDDAVSAACDRSNNDPESFTAPDVSSLVLAPSLLSSPAVHGQDRPAEDRNTSLSLSPRHPSQSWHVVEPPSALSFSPSPYSACMMPASPKTIHASPPLVSSPAGISAPMEVQEFMSETTDSTIVEDTPVFDFERYLQPSERCSLSPREAVAREMLSPMVADIEMESPKSEPTQEEEVMTPTAPLAVSTLCTAHTPQARTAEADMLLFTPDLKDRIRQSVCPSDLMVFTPPSDI